MKKIFWTILYASVLLTTAAAQDKGYLIEKEIQYRESTGDVYTDSICRLDVYFPEKEEGFSTLIWYHGGGLTGGSRDLPQELMNQGIAIVTADYRLSPQATVSECIDDAAAAAAWVVKNIASYGGDPHKIFVTGHSAGGYLTTMIGLDKHYLEPYGIDPDTAFAALIPYSGQAITHFTRRKEMGMTEMQPLIDEMAPLYHVRPDAVPIVIITGDRELEMVGRYEENAYFYRMLKLSGHPHTELYELKGFDHGTMPVPGHNIVLRYIKGHSRH